MKFPGSYITIAVRGDAIGLPDGILSGPFAGWREEIRAAACGGKSFGVSCSRSNADGRFEIPSGEPMVLLRRAIVICERGTSLVRKSTTDKNPALIGTVR